MKFTTAAILSCSTGILIEQGGMDGIYKVLSHLAGRSLFTHELPKAFKVYEPEINRQLPWTVGLAKPNGMGECITLLAACIDKHGKTHELTPRPELWAEVDKGILGNLHEAAPHLGPENVVVVKA